MTVTTSGTYETGQHITEKLVFKSSNGLHFFMQAAIRMTVGRRRRRCGRSFGLTRLD